MKWRGLAAFLAWCSVATGAAAQALPSDPVTFGGGRVVLGGEASVSLAPDDPGFFNYSDYEHSTLQELRLGVTARVRATDRVTLLTEVRSENMGRVSPFALYARITPFPRRRFDVQIGRIPPTFGSFPRQAYGRQNPLIGSPLAYQYLTSLRADAVPADADELLRMRGRGWLSQFSVGDPTPARGVPLVTAFHWDTGIQVSTGWRMLGVTAALTNGTLSRPLVSDDNDGKQIAARITVTPQFGLTVGTSFAQGQFLERRVLDLLAHADPGRFTQRAYGLDLEYARGHALVRADAVLSQWRIAMPAATSAAVPLRAAAVRLEGRYTVQAGVYVAARAEHLTFGRITGSAGRERWDAPVTRVEAGGGYYLQRNLEARAALQFNWRDAGRVTRARLLAGQLLFWF